MTDLKKENNEENVYPESNIEILKSLDELLKNDQQCPEAAVSVYDISWFLSKTYNQIECPKEDYMIKINSKLKDKYDSSIMSSVEYDFNKNEMIVDIISCISDVNMVLKLRKEKDDFYISECNNSKYKNEILPLIGTELADVFDSYSCHEGFYSQRSSIKSLNMEFTVDVDNKQINVTILKGLKLICKNGSDKIKIESSSLNVIKLLEGNEEVLLDKIYVRIDDCPEWMQVPLIKQKRARMEDEQRQIAFQQQTAQMLLEKSQKNGKTMRLVKKILPFIKKIDSN